MYLRTELGNPLTWNRRRRSYSLATKTFPFPQRHTGTLHLIVLSATAEKRQYGSADNNAYTNVEERRFSAA
jgi:hypothetical protein